MILNSTFLVEKIFKSNFNSMIVFLLVMTLTGCYQNVRLTQIPPNSEAVRSNQPTRLASVAYLKSIQVELNGAGVNTNDTFEKRFIGRLQETGLFKDIVGVEGRGALSEAANYELFLKVSENQQLDRAGNFIKGFFVGLSLFVLTPVLPMDYGMEENMTLTVRKPNGIEKKYYATAETSALYTLTHAQTAISKANGDACEACINSIMNQLLADDDLRSF